MRVRPLFSLLLLQIIPAVPSGFAQSFRAVLTDSFSFYRYVPSGEILSVKIDSFQAPGNGDTFWFNDRIALPRPGLPGNCTHFVHDTSWLGERFIVTPDLKYYFFNRAGDTILVDAQAGIGQSFVFYRYPSGDYLEAQVFSEAGDLVVGVLDYSRLYRLQARDTAGNVIPDDLNGREFRIAINYGFSMIFNLWDFPADTSTVLLEGVSKSQDGFAREQQHVDVTAIFDFQPGHEFHYHHYYDDDSLGIHHIRDIYEKRFILSRTTSVNNDTVCYEYQSTRYIHDSLTGGYDSAYLVTDSATVCYPLSGYAYLDSFPSNYFFAQEFRDDVVNVQPSWGYNRTFFADTLGKRANKQLFRAVSFDTAGQCLEVEPAIQQNESFIYGEGLGLRFYRQKGCCNYDYRSELVFYQKDLELWGVPIDFDQLVGIPSDGPSPSALLIRPNPVVDYLVLTPANENLPVRVMSVNGCVVKELKMIGGLVDVRDLQAGVYLIMVVSDGENLIGKFIKQ